MRIIPLAVALAMTMGLSAWVQAADAAQQASDLKASFRNGQTFLTWKQVPGIETEYRIYRSTNPFQSADDLTEEALVAQVGNFTGLNDWHSINRMELEQLRPGGEYEIKEWRYYVIEDGGKPLSSDTGLFVYTAKKDETAHYAVTAVVDGEEARTLDSGNATSEGVAEKVEEVEAVWQGDEKREHYVHWTDSVGTPLYPAMSSIPNVTYNFRVNVPEGQGPHPIILLMHGGFHQFSTPDSSRGEKFYDTEPKAIRIALDSAAVRGEKKVKDMKLPFIPPAGFYGYPDTAGTDRPLEEGTFVDYHGRRILWEAEWVAKKFNGDLNRVSATGGSMGGIGAMVMALAYPERMAAVKPNILAFRTPEFMLQNRDWVKGNAGSQPATAPRRLLTPEEVRAIQAEEAANDPADPDPTQMIAWIKAHPEIDYPFILLTAGRTDHIAGWPSNLEWIREAEKSKIPFTFYWFAGGHGGGGSAMLEETLRQKMVDNIPKRDLTSFSTKQSFPAFRNPSVKNDWGTVDVAVRPDIRPPLDAPGVGDLVGTYCGHFDWDRDTIVDEPNRWEMKLFIMDFFEQEKGAVDVTPRRTQAFDPKPGKSKRQYEVKDSASGNVFTSWEVTADDHGLVTVPQVPVSKSGTRLSIRFGA